MIIVYTSRYCTGLVCRVSVQWVFWLYRTNCRRQWVLYSQKTNCTDTRHTKPVLYRLYRAFETPLPGVRDFQKWVPLWIAIGRSQGPFEHTWMFLWDHGLFLKSRLKSSRNNSHAWMSKQRSDPEKILMPKWQLKNDPYDFALRKRSNHDRANNDSFEHYNFMVTLLNRYLVHEDSIWMFVNVQQYLVLLFCLQPVEQTIVQ